jgi:hypothetical protein
MVRRILVVCLTIGLILLAGCDGVNPVAGKGSFQEKGVSIIDKGNYFEVTLDFTSGVTHRQAGEAFARGILQVVPNYEALIDSYIAENMSNFIYSKYVIPRIKDLKPQLEQDYLDEIDGMATVFSGGGKNVRKDNKISLDEFYLFNLIPDIAHGNQCCFVSVFGARSATHSTISGRNLDWYGGGKNQLPQIQAIITMKSAQGKVCSIGYLGYMGVLTGFNDSKLFAAVLEAQTGAPFTSAGKRSYLLDLRYALENKKTLNEAADFMKSHANDYTVNHLIAFSDPEVSKVLENNFSGAGTGGQPIQCALRSADSRLNPGITWGISEAIGSVNSFLLYGNVDNHTPAEMNTKRWNNLTKQLRDKGPTVTPAEIQEVIAYNHGSPGRFMDSGDLYNRITLSMVLFQPESLSLEVFFHPRNTRKSPDHPVFEKIPVFQ